MGIVMRSFARTADKTAETAQRVLGALEQVAHYRGENWRVRDVLILIPVDRSYKDSDAGELAPAVRRGWNEYLERTDEGGQGPLTRVSVKVIESKGDLCMGLQNEAHEHLWGVCNIMVTLAPSAVRYFDLATADAMVAAFNSGAKVAAVAIPEDGLDELVNRGTPAGPITAWNVYALEEVGGFDEVVAQPKIGEENPNAGVEEIIPLARIIEKYGAVYAPIQSQAVTKKRVLEGEDLERHRKQIETKTERQLANARRLGVQGLEFFAKGMMPAYRAATL